MNSPTTSANAVTKNMPTKNIPQDTNDGFKIVRKSRKSLPSTKSQSLLTKPNQPAPPTSTPKFNDSRAGIIVVFIPNIPCPVIISETNKTIDETNCKNMNCKNTMFYAHPF